jgi:hypothetical protein
MNPKSFAEAKSILAERWPHLFTFPVPLKIGIHKDFPPVGERPMTRKRFCRFLEVWCSRPEYEDAVYFAKGRYGFDGSLHPVIRRKE